MSNQEKKQLATIKLFERDQWPIFLKDPNHWRHVKIHGKHRTILSTRVELQDAGQGFIHQREKRVYKDDFDFGEALESFVGFEISDAREYVIALRDYFRKEMEHRDRFEPIYEKTLDRFYAQRNERNF